MGEKAPPPWHQSAFKVGVLGLALMLAGYFVMRGAPASESPGRLVFFLGLAVIAAACILWYNQAQQEAPQEAAEEEAPEPTADDDEPD